MPYIGKQLVRGQNRKLDDISSSFNGAATTFNLTVDSDSVTPGSALQLFISVDGVLQNPNTDFTVAGNQITFTTAPGSGLSFFGILQGDAVDFNIPADGSVTTPKLSSNLSINADKLQFTQSGTGAVQRTVESKLQDVVSVKDFGAVGDGVADDSSAIENATKTGATVFFPKGTYKVNRSLNTNGYLNWLGEPGSIIDVSGVPDSAGYVFLQYRGGTVKGVTIEMGGSQIGYQDAVSNTAINSAWNTFTFEDTSSNVLATSSGGSLTYSVGGYSVTATKNTADDFITVTLASNFVGEFHVVSDFITLPNDTDFFVVHADQYSPIFEISSWLQAYSFELYDSSNNFIRTWSPAAIEPLAGGFPLDIAINSAVTGSGVAKMKMRLVFYRVNTGEAAGTTKFFTNRFYVFKCVNKLSNTASNVGEVFQININMGYNNQTIFDSCTFLNANKRRPGIISGGTGAAPSSVDDLVNSPVITNCTSMFSPLISAQRVRDMTYTNNKGDGRVKYEGTYTDSFGRSMNGSLFFNYAYRTKIVGGLHWSDCVFSNNTLTGGHWTFEVTPNYFLNGGIQRPMSKVVKNNYIEGAVTAMSFPYNGGAVYEGNVFKTLQGWNTFGLELAKYCTDVKVISNTIIMGQSIGGGNAITCRGNITSFVGPTDAPYKLEFISNKVEGKVAIQNIPDGGLPNGKLIVTGNSFKTYSLSVLSFGGDCYITNNTMRRMENVSYIQKNYQGRTIYVEDRNNNDSGANPTLEAIITGNYIDSMSEGAIGIGRSAVSASMNFALIKDNSINLVGDVYALTGYVASANDSKTIVDNNTLLGVTPSSGYYSVGGTESRLVGINNKNSDGNPIKLSKVLDKNYLSGYTTNPFYIAWFTHFGSGVWDLTVTFVVNVDGTFSPTAGDYTATRTYKVVAEEEAPGSTAKNVNFTPITSLVTQTGTALGSVSDSISLSNPNTGSIEVELTNTPTDTTSVTTSLYAVRIS